MAICAIMSAMLNIKSLSHHILFDMPCAGWLLFSATSGALAFAFIMQYGFDVHPCILCLWQRAPIGIAAILALTSVLWRPYGRQTQILFAVCAFVFLIELALAVFHTGVELHWWLGTSGCVLKPLNASSAEDLRQQLLHTVVARCDQISWTLFGLSMANWNVPFSLALAGYTATVSRLNAFQVGKK